MLAGNMKLTHFLGLVGLGGVVIVGGLGWWWSSQPEPPADAIPAVDSKVLAPQAATPPDAPAQAPQASSPVARLPAAEQAAMDWQGKALPSKKLKDVSSGEAYKINVYQDEGRTSANRLKIDLDRDDNWDQKWTFHDDGQISRKVAPNDDENYTIEQIWGADGWADAP